MKPRLAICGLAERDHKKSKRQYAHVGHVVGVICVCEAFYELPLEYADAILLHELAHLVYPDEEDEAEVDVAAAELFEIPVGRMADTKYGKDLQFIGKRDVSRAEKVLVKLVIR